jgi:hypothetical protein
MWMVRWLVLTCGTPVSVLTLTSCLCPNFRLGNCGRRDVCVVSRLTDRLTILGNASGTLRPIAHGTAQRTYVKDSEKWLNLKQLAQ